MLPKYRDLALGALIQRAGQDGNRTKGEDGPEKSGEGGQLSVLATILAAIKACILQNHKLSDATKRKPTE